MSVAEMDASTRDVERTSRDTTVAQWCVAAVVMAGSAAAGAVTFHHLGEHPALGVVTAIGVDTALAAWLLISRRLRAVGVGAPLGHALEVVTAAMTLYLNVGSAVFAGIDPGTHVARVLLGVAHSFLPIVLVLVSLAGGQAQLRLLRLRRWTAAQEQADLKARLAAEKAVHDAQQSKRRDAEIKRAQGVLLDAQDHLDKARELRREAQQEQEEAARLRATTETEVAATKQATEALRRGQRKRDNAGGPQRDRPLVATRDERRQWVRDERAAGRNPSGADVDKKFGPPRTGAAILREVDNEHRTLHAVGA